MASQRLPPVLPLRTMSGRYFYGWNVVGATLGGVTLTPALYPGRPGGYREGSSWDEERSSERARSVNRAFVPLMLRRSEERRRRHRRRNQASNKLRSERCRRVIGSVASM